MAFAQNGQPSFGIFSRLLRDQFTSITLHLNIGYPLISVLHFFGLEIEVFLFDSSVSHRGAKCLTHKSLLRWLRSKT